MKNKFLVSILSLVAATLLGCGGGGGGGGSSGISDAGGVGGGGLSISVFSAGGSLNGPRHMVFYGGNLYVANQGGNNILMIDSLGNQTVRLTGITDPLGITTDGDDFFVSGTVAGIGQGVFPFTAAAGNLRARLATCNCYGLVATPTIAVINGSGRLYSVDQGGNVVKVYTSAGLRNSLVVGNGPTGLGFYNDIVYVTRNTATMSTVDVNDFAATFNVNDASLFTKPNGIAINPSNGDMYVVNERISAESNVLKVTAAGVVSEFLPATPSSKLCNATGVAIKDNALYISNGNCASGATAADKNYILKVSPI
jgi:DNA-binding beta-propeller fold protein YncE